MGAGMGGMMGLPFEAAGGIMGAQAADQANQQNWAINQENFALQNNAIDAAQNAAAQQRRDALTQQTRDAMGTTDAMGNQTYFDPAKGWVTALSNMGKTEQQQAFNLNTAQNQEKMAELNQDVPLERQQMQAASQQNNQSANQADAFSRMLHDAILQGPDKNNSSQLYAAQSKGINDAFNAQQSDASRTAIRSGASNIGPALAELAKARSDALSQASVQDYMQGRQQSQGDYNNKIAGLASLVNSFDQASRSPLNPAQYQPSDASQFVPQSAASQSALMQMMQSSDPSVVGDPSLIQTMGKYPNIDYVQPNYGGADAMVGIGNAFSKLGGTGGSSGGSSLNNAFMGNSGVF